MKYIPDSPRENRGTLFGVYRTAYILRLIEILHPFSDTIPHFWEPLDAEQEENNSKEIQELCKSDLPIKLSLPIP